MPRKKPKPYRRITPDRQARGARLRTALARNFAAPKSGRPSLYRSGFCELATSFCLLGATNEELASRFGVTKETVQDWMREKPEFKAAVHAGREGFDERVAGALGQRALGYSHPEEVIHFTKGGRVLRAKTRKQYPPDPTAAKFWLTNRRAAMGEKEGNAWSEKVEHSGPGGGPIDVAVNFVRSEKKKKE